MKPEVKVGAMFVITLVMIALFAFYLGVVNPFSSHRTLRVAYNFAGGVEVGSPVRVMGIKVGKVLAIDFDPQLKMPSGEEVKLLVKISISKKAWATVRRDSQFYINLAGVIGEKFVEITPGAAEEPGLKNNALVRGEDPPRIDQLISQSYGLAGKLFEMIKNNEGSVVDTIKMMNDLVSNLNKLLTQVDKTTSNKQVNAMIRNLATITDDMAFFTQKLRSEDSQHTMRLLNKLIWRLESLDGPTIRKFLQEEGIKARMF